MDLKDCPFCGGVAETDSLQPYRAIHDGHMGNQAAIYCTGSCSATMTLCHADVPHMTPEECLQVLTENWNRRAPTVGAPR
jgi:hypothetical protein